MFYMLYIVFSPNPYEIIHFCSHIQALLHAYMSVCMCNTFSASPLDVTFKPELWDMVSYTVYMSLPSLALFLSSLMLITFYIIYDQYISHGLVLFSAGFPWSRLWTWRLKDCGSSCLISFSLKLSSKTGVFMNTTVHVPTVALVFTYTNDNKHYLM